MQSAIDQFRINISRVRDLIAIHNSVKSQTTVALDVSDMLRAAIVLTVSALDYYIHEVVRMGMIEIHRGQRPEPRPSSNTADSAFSRFQVSLGSARQDRLIAIDISNWIENDIQQTYGPDAEDILQLNIHRLTTTISNMIENRLNNTAWLEDEIRARHAYQSFQYPDKIADAIRLISDQKIWDEVGRQLGKPARDIKQQLTEIVDRRNKIAHEADIDPTYNLGQRWPINEILVSDAVDFIAELVETIHKVIE